MRIFRLQHGPLQYKTTRHYFARLVDVRRFFSVKHIEFEMILTAWWSITWYPMYIIVIRRILTNGVFTTSQNLSTCVSWKTSLFFAIFQNDNSCNLHFTWHTVIFYYKIDCIHYFVHRQMNLKKTNRTFNESLRRAVRFYRFTSRWTKWFIQSLLTNV